MSKSVIRPEGDEHASLEAAGVAAASGADAGALVATPWAAMPARRRGSRWRRWRNPIGIVGAAIVGFNVLVALFGSMVYRRDPDEQPYDRLLGPSWNNPMGTDKLGRNVLARVIHCS